MIARGGIHLIGDQKNYGWSLSSQPVTTFFDVDDVPHPQRIEILEEYFSHDPSIDYFLAGYTPLKGRPNRLFYERIEVGKLSTRYNLRPEDIRPTYSRFYQEYQKEFADPFTKGLPCCCGAVSRKKVPNGWPTVRTDLLPVANFSETLRDFEDCYMFLTLNWRGYNCYTAGHIDLGYYVRGSFRKLGHCLNATLIERPSGRFSLF
mmetsp:Transcript_26820/g.66766  ORF Transcript_26820/g.66766 Transcript_26820/m.66766 type:complete len:205 (+) Transcript_26820:289-903(+)